MANAAPACSPRVALVLAAALSACSRAPTTSADAPMSDAAFEAELDTVPLMPSPLAAPLGPSAGATAALPPDAAARPASTLRPRTHRDPICVTRTRPSVAPRSNLQGDIARSVIQSPVRGARARMGRCYASALERDPSVEGRLAIRFVVEADGSVREACEARRESDEDAIDDPELVRCLAEVFTQLEFPAPTDGSTVTVTYPLQFRPE